MLSAFLPYFDNLLLKISLTEAVRRRLAMHQNNLDIEEMPETWKRDIGLLDGRHRRGPQKENAIAAAHFIHSPRNL